MWGGKIIAATLWDGKRGGPKAGTEPQFGGFWRGGERGGVPAVPPFPNSAPFAPILPRHHFVLSATAALRWSGRRCASAPRGWARGGGRRGGAAGPPVRGWSPEQRVPHRPAPPRTAPPGARSAGGAVGDRGLSRYARGASGVGASPWVLRESVPSSPVPSGPEESRAGPSRAELLEPTWAEQSRTEQNGAEQSRAARTEPFRAALCPADGERSNSAPHTATRSCGTAGSVSDPSRTATPQRTRGGAVGEGGKRRSDPAGPKFGVRFEAERKQ